MSVPLLDPRRLELDLPFRPLVAWEWGDADAPPIVLVHGWGDSGATFEFVAAALAADYRLIAPDLAGFGESPAAQGDYWFPDYLQDLEGVLDATVGAAPVTLVGHSMGGNVCNLYAGVRPARIASLVLLEGFGLPPTTPDEAPQRYARWLDQRHATPALRDFADVGTLHRHLQRLAPSAAPEVLAAIALRWARPVGDGAWRLRMDPRHKGGHAVLYRREEAAACWRDTTAPVMLVGGTCSDFFARFAGFDPVADCAAHYRRCTTHWLEGAGHMMHWEQPLAVAALIREAAGRAAQGAA